MLLLFEYYMRPQLEDSPTVITKMRQAGQDE